MKVGCLARLSEMKTVYGGVLQYMLLEGGDYDVDETHDRCVGRAQPQVECH